jgi:hypothetical protein
MFACTIGLPIWRVRSPSLHPAWMRSTTTSRRRSLPPSAATASPRPRRASRLRPVRLPLLAPRPRSPTPRPTTTIPACTSLVAGGTAVAVGTATGVAVTGTFAASGDVAINTNKFTVTAASGNTLVAGTLAVTGASTLTGAVGVTGDFAVNTNKFTVAASSGNTLVAGTLAVTGAATLSSTLAAGNTAITGTLAASGNVAINTDKFTVAAASGNTLVAGTLAVTGASTFTGLMTGRIPLLHVRDEKADNTDGGTFTSGAWRTRTLNTEVTNEISGASLAANQITLPAGTYEIEASAPGFNCGDHKAKLCNITDTADTLVGTSESAGAANNSNGRSLVRGRFTIAGAKVFELQHRCSSSQATNGLGQGGGFGVVEVYTDVIIRKVV